MSRYLYVRLLLLRLIFLNFIKTDARHARGQPFPDDSLARRMALQCSITCVDVARESIEIIHREKRILPGKVGFLSAWWYNILFLYASATVLVAANFNNAIMCEISADLVFDALRKASELLGKYARFSKPVRCCLKTLQHLSNAISNNSTQSIQVDRNTQQGVSLCNTVRSPIADSDGNRTVPVSMDVFNEFPTDNEVFQGGNELDSELAETWHTDIAFQQDYLSWLVPQDLLSGV